MRPVKIAVRWVTRYAAALAATAGSNRCGAGRHYSRFAGSGLLITLLLLASAGSARANVTLSEFTVYPECTASPTNAQVDGTSRTLFIFTVSVTVPTNERIQTEPGTNLASGQNGGVGYVRCGGFPMQRIYSTDGYGGGYFRLSLPGWYFRRDDDTLPTGHSMTVTAYAVPTDTSTPSAQQINVGFGITGRNREVLIPVDATGNSDQFKTPKKAGGVTIEPADPANYGDGSGSATYTFRVRYMDPEGLPPRPWPAGGRFDQLGPGIHNTVNNMELDQYNVPRRIDDPWRFVTPTDPTLPTGVAPPTYRSGVYVVFDDNGDGNVLLSPTVAPDQVDWFTNWSANDRTVLARGMDAPRMMVIDTVLQPQFLSRNPTAADWRSGVVFKYTCLATDHSVSVGIPRFFEFGASILQFALSPFTGTPGQKYLNAGRTTLADLNNPAYDPKIYDARTRSFVSLPSGLRRYSFFTSNDIQYCTIPPYRGIGVSLNFGTQLSMTDPRGYTETRFGGGGPQPNPYDICRRWFQQPNFNLPKTDPASPPQNVFHPPFEIRVDPQITVDQVQLRGDTALSLIGIPTAVVALRPDALGVKQPVPLFADDVNRARPSRLRATDEIQWRFYYTQSEGLPPTVCEMHLLKEDDSGSFVRVPQSPFACTTLTASPLGKDPIYAQFADSSHAVNAFYARYGVTFPGPAAPALEPGVYRYYFRASDGRRTAEWPGDSAGRTSLTTLSRVSHVSNTLRINRPPSLLTPTAVPTVDPRTGAVSWAIQVTYADGDGDRPSSPLVIFPDPQGNPADDLVLVMQQDPSTTDFVQGVRYRLQSATDPTVGAFRGRREYFFAFTDNWKDAANPESGEQTTEPAVDATTGVQPKLFLNSQPFLLNATVVNERTGTDRGALGDNYVFRVTYGDNERDRPLEDVNGTPQVRLYVDGRATDFYLRTEDPTPDFTKGVIYSVTVNGRQIGPGTHTFEIRAKDAPPDATQGLDAVPVGGTGPSIDVPVLSEPGVSGSPDPDGQPGTGYPATDFVYQVRYRHQGGRLPNHVTVHVLNPSPAGTLPTELASIRLTKVPGQDDALVSTTGLVYSNAVADGTSPGPYRFAATGTYAYYFEASDGDSIKRLYQYDAPAPAIPVSFTGPIVAGPALTPQNVDPVRGVTAQPFAFRVLYSHPAGIQPTLVRLRLLDPVGQPVALPNGGDMSAPANAVTANLTNPGWLYTIGNVALTQPGTYRYSFTASDGASTVETPVPMAEGPTAVAVDPPVLSDASVQPTAGDQGKVTYRLTYRQSQNLVPTIFVVVENREYPMAQENPSDTDMTDGAVYARTLDRPAGDGPHVYYFLVRGPGINTRYPASNAVGPNVMPTLMVHPQGTVAPAAGHTGTPFTFRVLCRDVDAPSDPTASGFPRVSVTVGNQKIRMEYKAGNLQQEGAEFAITTKLPAGNLTHSFSAEDGFDTARLIDTTTDRPFAGPGILAETKLNLTLTPERLSLDGMTPIRVSGALDPAIPSTDLTMTYTLPTGTAVKQIVTATAEGRFSDTFIPDRSGSWTVTAEFPSDTARGIGGGYQQATIVVDPAQISIPAGLRLMGMPVVPEGGTLASVFGSSGYALARWNGAAYDFAPGGAMGTPAPGEGFWIYSAAGTTAQAAGTTVLHNQAKSVPIRKGWNQVANPFLLPISWSTVTFQEAGGTSISLAQAAQASLADRKIHDHAWLYDGRQYVLLHASVPGARRDVGAWQGLWIKSNVAGNLIFAPPVTRSPQIAEEPVGRRPRAQSGDWSLQLVATNGPQTDSFNFAGVTGDGRTAALSGLESPPPVLREGIDLYFTGQGGTGRYAADYRSSAALPQVYDFVVETDVRDRAVSVRCPNLSELPKDLDVLLEDVDAAGKRVYLRTTSGYSFNPGDSGSRHLRLIVQRRTDGALRIGSISIGATRAGRSINFSVSRASMATVEILAPSGKRLKMLADRRAVDEGINTMSWDLSRSDGTRLPRGIYLVQITATTPEGQTARAVKPIAVVTW